MSVFFVFDQAHCHLEHKRVEESAQFNQCTTQLLLFLTITHADSDAWKVLTSLNRKEKRKERCRNTVTAAKIFTHSLVIATITVRRLFCGIIKISRREAGGRVGMKCQTDTTESKGPGESRRK